LNVFSIERSSDFEHVQNELTPERFTDRR